MKNKTDFENVWSKKIIDDLGSDRYQKLFSQTNEGVKISPFYTRDRKSIINPNDYLIPKKWNILYDINCVNSYDLTEEIKNLIKNEIINICLTGFDEKLYQILIKKFKYSKVNFYFKSSEIPNFDFKNIKNFHLLIEPSLEVNQKSDFKNLISKRKFKLNFSSKYLKNSGANIVQEIAFILSAANEYLKIYGKEISKNISFEVVQGENYFFEIAKIQSLRILWSLITKKYGNQVDDCIVTATPTIKNKTIKNFNNNIIRSTTECMSGILGGCDFIKSIPYDFFNKNKNSFSERIMYNQLLILRNETFINKTINPISGSYYISYLIDDLSEKSLDLFKKIESKGGYFNNLKENGLFKQIFENAKKENDQYKSNEKIQVGVNKYVDEL
tara:strand:+ start:5502 stop:6659 length:1158 start_codon:yes stop_codon:yes gene_type:complete